MSLTNGIYMNGLYSSHTCPIIQHTKLVSWSYTQCASKINQPCTTIQNEYIRHIVWVERLKVVLAHMYPSRNNNGRATYFAHNCKKAQKPNKSFWVFQVESHDDLCDYFSLHPLGILHVCNHDNIFTLLVRLLFHVEPLEVRCNYII